MSDRPAARLCEHQGGVDVELTVPWPTDTSPVASALLDISDARQLALDLLKAARLVRERRALLGITNPDPVRVF